MSDFTEERIKLILQLVIKIAKKQGLNKEVDELCDWYGHWEDDEEFTSGEKRID